MTSRAILDGRLVLDDRVVGGRIAIEDGQIVGGRARRAGARPAGPGPRPVHRPRVRRRARPWRRRSRRHGRSCGPRRHVPAPPATRRDVVPADRGHRAATGPGGVRRARPELAAGSPRRRVRAARVQPRRPVPGRRQERGARSGPPAGPGRRAPRDARAAGRRAPAADDRPGAAGRGRAHRLAARAWGCDLDRPLGRDVRRGLGPATGPAGPRPRTCSTP